MVGPVVMAPLEVLLSDLVCFDSGCSAGGNPSSPCVSLSACLSSWLGPIERLLVGCEIKVSLDSFKMCVTISMGCADGTPCFAGWNSTVLAIWVLLVLGMQHVKFLQ